MERELQKRTNKGGQIKYGAVKKGINGNIIGDSEWL